MSADALVPSAANGPFQVGQWRVDPDLNQISCERETLRLEPRTMRLLVRLAATPGQVVSSRELLDTVWAGVVVGPASVYQAISQLRKLLGDTDPVPTFIATVPRKGYRLVAPVRRIDEPVPEVPATQAPPPSAAAKQSRPYLFWGITAVLVVALGTTAWFAVRHPPQPPSAGIPAPPSTLDSRAIAVAPFKAATQDEATQMLAPIVTDLLRTRLAALQNLVVVAGDSIASAMQIYNDPTAVARKVHAGYLLQGQVRRAQDQVQLNVTLTDVKAGTSVWSLRFEQPVEEIASINEEIAAQTANALKIVLGPGNGNAAAYIPADLSTYQLYLQGQKLLSTFRAADAEQAAIIFSRVTTLDPSFARGYYSLGEALMLAADLGGMPMTEDLVRRANQAFMRALELNPALGPAWAQRARLTSDPVQAEEWYRRALLLEPSYDESYIRYSDFLYSQGRRGEALDLIDRARKIDPLSSTLCWRKAQLLLATRGDTEGMERLLNEALELTPDFPTALRELATAKYLWHGEFAEAIRLMERARAVDPDTYWADLLTIELYLEVGDLPAAIAAQRDVQRAGVMPMQKLSLSVPIHQRDIQGAAAEARKVLDAWLPPRASTQVLNDTSRVQAIYQELAGYYWSAALALRDEAIVTGDFRSALDLVERATMVLSQGSPMRNRGLLLTYAHLLLLAGETQRGRALLETMLEHLDAEQIGRPEHTYAWERATAYAMLGEDERALTELEASQKSGRFAGWWYTAELDPAYSRVRQHPRFQAMAERACAHAREQRALLDEMRSSGKVPARS